MFCYFNADLYKKKEIRLFFHELIKILILLALSSTQGSICKTVKSHFVNGQRFRVYVYRWYRLVLEPLETISSEESVWARRYFID